MLLSYRFEMTIGHVQAVSVKACAHHEGMATASAVE